MQFLANQVQGNSAYQIGSNALTKGHDDPEGEPLLPERPEGSLLAERRLGASFAQFVGPVAQP